ncbi:DUF5064 family protein [Azomonas macrocytogenes]|uniref:Uncharacterized protein n=1 Tax=Azomonas macrocytogenes TaxID=69962 RepID=A0A839T2V0_AZOMA|nr:DUF5064 family protein [Azomonas macrocytogenes]MBB3102295.1 hypothetical protein [Azomonas macrocytogenes]
MFKPGHLNRILFGSSGQPEARIDLRYKVRDDPNEGLMLCFHMRGDMKGKSFEEDFELHRDTAFNFASVASYIAARHGFPVNRSPIMRDRADYEQMFDDIRCKLGLRCGEPVNFDHVDKDFYRPSSWL